METIKWIIEFIPKSVRALFSCLLIAIMTLSGVVYYLNNQNINLNEERRLVTYQMTKNCDKQKDSLQRVILDIKDQNKKELVDMLEVRIKEQNEQLKVQDIKILKLEKK